jgi:LmbE family N-acetylglucosaminyl deacetylase
MFAYTAPTLFLVAHPDDESLGGAIILQRVKKALVVFCTSGAVLMPPVWLRYGTPRRYGKIREAEAEAAVQLAGDHKTEFLRFKDSKTHQYLSEIYSRVAALVASFQPHAIVTHALEGAHEDHDVCSFIAQHLAQKFPVEVWEMALYYKSDKTGEIIRNAFRNELEPAQVLKPTAQELGTKNKMLAAHQSQKHIVERFDSSRELIRRQTPVSEYRYLSRQAQGLTVNKTRVDAIVRKFERFEYPCV